MLIRDTAEIIKVDTLLLAFTWPVFRATVMLCRIDRARKRMGDLAIGDEDLRNSRLGLSIRYSCARFRLRRL